MKIIESLEACITRSRFEEIIKEKGYAIELQRKKDDVTTHHLSKQGNREYEWLTKKDEKHEWGSGGYILEELTLQKDQKPILMSRYRSTWDTTSDDTIDYDTGTRRITELYQEDALAREVFNDLKKEVGKND